MAYKMSGTGMGIVFGFLMEISDLYTMGRCSINEGIIQMPIDRQKIMLRHQQNVLLHKNQLIHRNLKPLPTGETLGEMKEVADMQQQRKAAMNMH